jgi:Flp pilus assembly protein TadB
MEYDSILQLCAIIFLVFMVYLLFKYVVYLIRKNRLVDFSLKVRTNRSNPILRAIKSTSSTLKAIPFIKGKKYNGYARLVPGFDDGYDIISSKVLCSLFMLFLYVFVSVLYKSNINITVVLITLILGYVILDFYYIYNSRNVSKLVSKDMLGAVIIMNNDFKANRSVEQAINDVIERKTGPISKEFKKVLDDTELGLSYGDAFMRMYKRTKIDCVLDISHAFSLYTMIGSDLIEIFDTIEEKIIEEEKFLIHVRAIKVFNKLFKLLFNVMPILIVALMFLLNEKYLKLIMGGKGIVFICLLVLLFIVYIVTINKIVRRYNYDNK